LVSPAEMKQRIQNVVLRREQQMGLMYGDDLILKISLFRYLCSKKLNIFSILGKLNP